MKILFLSGYGIDLRVDSGRLVIKDGRDLNKEPIEIVLKPKSDDYDLGVWQDSHSYDLALSLVY